MQDFAEWSARHPGVMVAFVVGMGAAVTLNIFRIGVAYANVRATVGELDRAASEALGG